MSSLEYTPVERFAATSKIVIQETCIHTRYDQDIIGMYVDMHAYICMHSINYIHALLTLIYIHTHA